MCTLFQIIPYVFSNIQDFIIDNFYFNGGLFFFTFLLRMTLTVSLGLCFLMVNFQNHNKNLIACVITSHRKNKLFLIYIFFFNDKEKKKLTLNDSCIPEAKNGIFKGWRSSSRRICGTELSMINLLNQKKIWKQQDIFSREDKRMNYC